MIKVKHGQVKYLLKIIQLICGKARSQTHTFFFLPSVFVFGFFSVNFLFSPYFGLKYWKGKKSPIYPSHRFSNCERVGIFALSFLLPLCIVDMCSFNSEIRAFRKSKEFAYIPRVQSRSEY